MKMPSYKLKLANNSLSQSKFNKNSNKIFDQFLLTIKEIDKKKLFKYVLIAFAGMLLIFTAIWLLKPKPKTYAEYKKHADEVLQANTIAAEVSHVYQPIEKQIGKENYQKYVLGSSTDKNDNYQSAASVATKFAEAVADNNRVTKEMAGVGELAQLKERRTGKVTDPEMEKLIQKNIAQGLGETPDQMAMANAIYINK